MGVRSWILVVCACAAVAAPAHANDDPAALQKRGEQLAKDGQFAEAIDVFKAADADRPSTELACLIGLAYGRRNLYGQAALFFDQCHERAENGDPVPSWVPKVEQQFRARLASSRLVPVKIVVKHGRKPKVVVSAFEPDETFSPRVVHLSPGRHTITVTDADRAAVERTVVVEEGEPKTVTFDLAKSVDEPDEQMPAARTDHLGRNVVFAGLGIAVLGAIVHATWYKSELDELEAAQNPPDVQRYDAHVDAYEQARYVTVGLYAVGAATVVVGAVLHATRKPDETGPTVSLRPTNGGGIFAVEWSR